MFEDEYKTWKLYKDRFNLLKCGKRLDEANLFLHTIHPIYLSKSIEQLTSLS